MSAAGLVWVLRSTAATPWRAIGLAAPVALVLVIVSGGKAYYTIGATPCSWRPAESSSTDGWRGAINA
ncbi:MAG TPA: hypothetical protein VHN80_21745 [Kineosporiaceae bacterium]|nr:hypothetical protein [Kineosporiaceae bacterium]